MTIRNSQADHDDESFSISIWLLPLPEYRSKLAKAIATFSQQECASVPFEPHVTVLGGLHCPSEHYLRTTLIPRLQQGIQQTSTRLDCRFETQPTYESKWNQACVMVMEESEEFRQLVFLCREIAFGTPSLDPGYPPPLCKPHMSLYYGDEEGAPSPEEVQLALGFDNNNNNNNNNGFEAGSIAIWKTDPATTKGVAEWKELAVMDLPQRVVAKSQ